MKRNHHQLREWALDLMKWEPDGLGKTLLEYAEAWEAERDELLERLNNVHEQLGEKQ